MKVHPSCRKVAPNCKSELKRTSSLIPNVTLIQEMGESQEEIRRRSSTFVRGFFDLILLFLVLLILFFKKKMNYNFQRKIGSQKYLIPNISNIQLLILIFIQNKKKKNFDVFRIINYFLFKKKDNSCWILKLDSKIFERTTFYFDPSKIDLGSCFFFFFSSFSLSFFLFFSSLPLFTLSLSLFQDPISSYHELFGFPPPMEKCKTFAKQIFCRLSRLNKEQVLFLSSSLPFFPIPFFLSFLF